MLDSSSSEEEDTAGGFGGYGNKSASSVGAGSSRRGMVSGRSGSGRQYGRPIAQDSTSSIGANTPDGQRYSGKWADSHAISAGMTDYCDQPSTPYRNVPSSHSSVPQQGSLHERSRHSSSRNSAHDAHDDRAGQGQHHRGPQSR